MTKNAEQELSIAMSVYPKEVGIGPMHQVDEIITECNDPIPAQSYNNIYVGDTHAATVATSNIKIDEGSTNAAAKPYISFNKNFGASSTNYVKLVQTHGIQGIYDFKIQEQGDQIIEEMKQKEIDAINNKYKKIQEKVNFLKTTLINKAIDHDKGIIVFDAKEKISEYISIDNMTTDQIKGLIEKLNKQLVKNKDESFDNIEL